MNVPNNLKYWRLPHTHEVIIIIIIFFVVDKRFSFASLFIIKCKPQSSMHSMPACVLSEHIRNRTETGLLGEGGVWSHIKGVSVNMNDISDQTFPDNSRRKPRLYELNLDSSQHKMYVSPITNNLHRIVRIT